MINPKAVFANMQTLSKAAGKEILKMYKKGVAVEYKSDDSPITAADKAANEIIVNGLKECHPNIPILAEESVDNPLRLKERFCFLVDPLDGTKEFIKENDEFTVNIALTELGSPIGGVIYVPVYEELYYAWKGMGAYSQINNERKNIFVSERTKNIRLAKSRSYEDERLDKLIMTNQDMISEVIIAGSAYKGCLLAKGDVEAYYRYGRTMEWDTAAMEIIVSEAGGAFLGLDGKSFLYNKKNPENPTGFHVINKKENALLLPKEQ